VLFGDDVALEIQAYIDRIAVPHSDAAPDTLVVLFRLRSLASIVENSDDAIVSKNLDGIITSWNRAAEHIFDYTAEEAVGQPITILIPEDRQSLS
jgi:PAS domain-containing protein